MVRNTACRVEAIIVAMDLCVEIVIQHCGGDELTAAHNQRGPVENRRVENLVIASGDAGVNVDDEDSLLEGRGPCRGAASREGLAS